MEIAAADAHGPAADEDVVVADDPRRRDLADLDRPDAGEESGFHRSLIILRGAASSLHNPRRSPSTSRAKEKSGNSNFPPGIVRQVARNGKSAGPSSRTILTPLASGAYSPLRRRPRGGNHEEETHRPFARDRASARLRRARDGRPGEARPPDGRPHPGRGARELEDHGPSHLPVRCLLPAAAGLAAVRPGRRVGRRQGQGARTGQRRDGALRDVRPQLGAPEVLRGHDRPPVHAHHRLSEGLDARHERRPQGPGRPDHGQDGRRPRQV